MARASLLVCVAAFTFATPFAAAPPVVPGHEIALHGVLVAASCSGSYDLTLSGIEDNGHWALRASVAPVTTISSCAFRSITLTSYAAQFDPNVGTCLSDGNAAHTLCLASPSMTDVRAKYDATFAPGTPSEMHGPIEGPFLAT